MGHYDEAYEETYAERRREESKAEWSGSPDPADPDNFWIDDATGERVNAATGERSLAARATMNTAQRLLARHALGLDYTHQKRSYRNRYFAPADSASRREWDDLVRNGHAETDGERFFWLTRKGAEAVLELGESLCPEDFPILEVAA